MNHTDRQRELDAIDGNTFAWMQDRKREDQPTDEERDLDLFERDQ